MIQHLTNEHLVELNKIAKEKFKETPNDLIKDIIDFSDFYGIRHNHLAHEKYRVSMKTISDSVCEYFNTTPHLIFKKSRKQPYVRYRQWFRFFCKHLNDSITLDEIALYRNWNNGEKMNHATIISSCKAIEDAITTYKDDEKIFTELKFLILKNHKLDKYGITR